MKKLHHCKVCGENDISKFHVSRKNKCKLCLSNEYKSREDKAEYINKQKLWVEKNFLHSQILQAKHRALRDNRVFDITDEIVLEKLKQQNHLCYVSKLPVLLIPKTPYSLSLDRLDNEIGYTVDNTIIVTKFVNNCKNTFSLPDFIKYMKEVCKNLE